MEYSLQLFRNKRTSSVKLSLLILNLILFAFNRFSSPLLLVSVEHMYICQGEKKSAAGKCITQTAELTVIRMPLHELHMMCVLEANNYPCFTVPLLLATFALSLL